MLINFQTARKKNVMKFMERLRILNNQLNNSKKLWRSIMEFHEIKNLIWKSLYYSGIEPSEKKIIGLARKWNGFSKEKVEKNIERIVFNKKRKGIEINLLSSRVYSFMKKRSLSIPKKEVQKLVKRFKKE